MRQALITGATSLTGIHLANTLISRNIPTRALIRHGDPAYVSLKRKGIEVQSGDVREEKVADRALKGVDVVFNCLGNTTDWMPYSEWRQLVVEGTRNICRASAKDNITRLVHLSSADVFGYHHKEIVTESSPTKHWGEPYPDTRIKTDEVVWLYNKEQHLPLTVIYPCKTYGENDLGFTASLALLIQNSSMRYWKKEMRFYPLYVGNLVDFMIASAESSSTEGKGYIIHDGKPRLLRDFCDRIAKELGIPAITQRVSYTRALLSANLNDTLSILTRSEKKPVITPYLIRSFKSSVDYSMRQAISDLDWTPPYTTRKGLDFTTDWMTRLDHETLKKSRHPIRF